MTERNEDGFKSAEAILTDSHREVSIGFQPGSLTIDLDSAVKYANVPSELHYRQREYEALLRSLPMDKLIELVERDKKQSDMSLNRIVSAANYHPGFPMIIGPRHWDDVMHASYAALEALYKRIYDEDLSSEQLPAGHHFAQGFIDKRGKWLTREEAWVIAEAAGQIIRRVGGDEANGGRLYSENLY